MGDTTTPTSFAFLAAKKLLNMGFFNRGSLRSHVKRARHHRHRNRPRQLIRRRSRKRRMMNRSTAPYRPELMSKSSALAVTSMTAAWTHTYLTNIARGQDVDDRNGSRVMLKYFLFNLSVHRIVTDATVRVLIIKRPLPDGTTLVTNDAMQSSNAVDSYRELDTKADYVFVRSWTFRLTANRPFRRLKGRIRINAPSTWKQADTTGLEINAVKNAYYIAWITDVGSNFPTIEGRFRMRFIDS